MKNIKTVARIMWLEWLASAKELVQYRKSVISEIISFFVAFILILGFSDMEYFKLTYGATGSQAVLHVLIGFSFWNFGNMAMGYAASVLTGDARTGLLESKAQAIVPYYLLIFSDMLVSLIVGMLTFLLAESYLVLTGQLFWGDLGASFLFLVFMLPSIIGMYGLGLIFGGLAFKEKTIGQYLSLFSILLIFISDIFGSEQMRFSFLVPFTLGIRLSRSFLAAGRMAWGDTVLYLLVNLLWLFIGVLVFNYAESRERKCGGLSNF